MKVSAFVITGALLLSVSGAYAQDINDAQIAKIVVTANQVDIDAGKLAAAKATNP
jgi:putative membrane protein